MKWLKRIGVGLLSLLGLIVVLVVALILVSQARQRKSYRIEMAPVAATSDSASLERGRHLVTTVSACGDCHGADLGGKTLIDSPVMGRFIAGNLTAGQGGLGPDYSDLDLARAIRHGVGRDGRSLRFMPSDAYQAFSDQDLAAVVAYIRSVPPIDRVHPATRIGPLARVLHIFGFPLLSAEKVDHGRRPAAPQAAVTAEYGEYLANVSGCRSCHGPALAGGSGPGPNITPAVIGSWSEADFGHVVREGRRPDGRQLKEEMPWKAYARMTDEEIAALWLYVKSVPPVAPKK
jgi:mono/diheme cytochrome c family protein